MLLSQKWLGRPLKNPPRIRLYEALPELLNDAPNEAKLHKILFCRSNASAVFHKLQQRFS